MDTRSLCKNARDIVEFAEKHRSTLDIKKIQAKPCGCRSLDCAVVLDQLVAKKEHWIYRGFRQFTKNAVDNTAAAGATIGLICLTVMTITWTCKAVVQEYQK